MSDKRYLVLMTCIALLLGACALRPVAPGAESGNSVRRPATGYHTVTAGETLYSIAWDAGRDYRSIAAWNNIPPPYVIRPGQKLKLEPPVSFRPAASRPAASGNFRVVARGDSLYSIAAEAGIDHRDLADWNDIPPPYVIRPGQRLRVKPPGTSTARARPGPGAKHRASPASPKSKAGKASASSRFGPWTWPTRGKIITPFSRKGTNKGLDIAGRRGQEIRSAASGRVVYQGSGLRGYGQLIIIKHNEDYLSAYAHCDRIYVKEGDYIKRGQKIAGMGNSGTDQIKLHFEIRYRGTPVDPARFLPKI